VWGFLSVNSALLSVHKALAIGMGLFQQVQGSFTENAQ